MPFDPYNIMHGAAVGAALGGGGQFAYNSFQNNKDRFPALGAVLGAGTGALTSMYLKKYKEKQEHTPTQQRLRPGLYYMERGIWGDINAFKGTDFHKYARHGFFLGVYDEKPEGIETERLPNGQYVVTFAGHPKMNEIGLPEGLYVAVNGKNPIAGIDSGMDLRAIKSLFDADAQKFTDYATTLHPLDLNPESSKKAIEKLYNTTKKIEGVSLGQYNPFDNNCISASAELARASGIDLKKMPSFMGVIGGVSTKDIPKLPDHIFDENNKPTSMFNFPWEKASSFKPAFTKKAKLKKAARYVYNKRFVKTQRMK